MKIHLNNFSPISLNTPRITKLQNQTETNTQCETADCISGQNKTSCSQAYDSVILIHINEAETVEMDECRGVGGLHTVCISDKMEGRW